MEWLDPNPIGVSHIGVRTGWGAKGVWKLRFEQNLKYPSPFGSSDNQKSNLSCTLIFCFFLFIHFLLYYSRSSSELSTSGKLKQITYV